MYELRIYDKNDNQKQVISNNEIINSLDVVDSNITKGKWDILKGMYGYGEYICLLEDEFKDKDIITVDGDKFFGIIRSKKEYFFHVCLHKCNSDIQIGLFDSTYYFIRSENATLLKNLQLLFRDTRLINIKKMRPCQHF